MTIFPQGVSFFSMIASFQYLPNWVLCASAALLGLIIGSFLNVVIYRLPIMLEAQWREESIPLNLMWPASHCPTCKTPIRWYHNIPVFSFFLLRGRCAACACAIDWQYPVIETLSAILFGLTAWFFGWTLAGFAIWVYVGFALCLSALDMRYHWLPDDLTLPLLWIGLFVNLYNLFASLQDAVIGAMAGYGVLWLLYWTFKLLTKKDGIGYGDFKLVAAIGAFCGWQALPVILLIASLSGLIFALGRLVWKPGSASAPLPFGPFLLIGGFLTLIKVTFMIEYWLSGIMY